MIQIENLTKRFGQHVAVNGVTLNITKGETLGLLGPNGAGKTTLMRMITGYLPPSDGRVLITGQDMFDQPSEVKRRIGYLPEQPPVYLDMTVHEYLLFAARIRGVEGSHLGERLATVGEQCGIGDMMGRLIGNLSKGYRQRVGLAQALIHDPDILILDEPTVGLDPAQIIEIRDLVRQLGQERTVVFSSHIMQEVTSVCSQIAIISHGSLVANDTIGALSSAMEQRQRVLVKVARPERLDFSRLMSLHNVVSVEKLENGEFVVIGGMSGDVREAVARESVAMDAGLQEIRLIGLTLEEVYLKAISS